MRLSYFLKRNKIHWILFGLLCIQSVYSLQAQQVNAERLEANLKKLSTFGKNALGGNDRVAFSDYDIEARAFLTTYLENLGLNVYTDAAGNLIAQRSGKKKGAKPIAFGSHIDAVPNGGHYDGDVGV